MLVEADEGKVFGIRRLKSSANQEQLLCKQFLINRRVLIFGVNIEIKLFALKSLG